jgi:hypothetical protein
MHRLRLAALTLPIAACSCEADPRDLRPPVELVERIEAQLAGRPCFGALNRWERHYGYGMGGDHRSPDRGVERNRITFTFVQAGIYGFRPRRLIESAREGLGIDERQMRFAFGEYDVPTRRLTVHGCGWNQDPDPAPS